MLGYKFHLVGVLSGLSENRVYDVAHDQHSTSGGSSSSAALAVAAI